jgi:hypothetical protein
VRLFIALALITSAPAQSWYPLHTGDRWIYQYDTRDDIGEGRGHLDVHSWKTEETITGSWNTPEGLLVAKHVRVIEGAPRRGWRVDPAPAYLLRGECLYAHVRWDPSTHQLTPELREGLTTYESPDFCFPLTIHKTWGAPHGLPDWAVTRPEDAKDWKVVGIEVREKRRLFHITSISAYPGAGITTEIWFEPGVGIVREDDIHHGTVGEVHTRLVRFEPAAP